MPSGSLYDLRPARPGFWRCVASGEGTDDDRHGTFERRTGSAPAQTSVPLLASRHAGNGLDHGPLRRRHRAAIDARGACRIRAPDGGAGSRALGLDHRRGRRAAGLRHRTVPPAERVQPKRRGCKMSVARNPAELLVPGRPLTLAGVADGAEGLVIADLARALAARADAPATTVVVVCRDGPRMAALSRALDFFAPDVAVQEFPAWDCLPYDRVSPHAGFVAQRMTTLSRLARVQGRDRPSVLLTTINAALQRVPTRDFVARQSLSVAPGNMLAMDGITEWLELNGFARARARRLCGARRHHRPLRAGHGGAGAARFFRRHAGDDPQLRPRKPAHDRPVARARSRAGGRIPAHHGNDPALPPRLRGGLRRPHARRPPLPRGERRPAPWRHRALAAAVS